MSLDSSTQSVGRIGHETLGAEYLRALGFSETVCRLVASHVPAKRYTQSSPSPHHYSSSQL